jgi:hypothetical protein
MLRKETGMSDLFWLTEEQAERLRVVISHEPRQASGE